ncbi:transcription activator HAP2 KNAG_0I00270 [Huiozyma naganishii CBS 8797]|uniref:Transcriptional activator HAP2 n=1 Tax=Huiozyma naganishii (strain ATCC MYA-139 / BCRC 22969 / CBS 8797 / KCTC 17520 / NBRC 10181 / NCYC 3082 / Yp74L-3) TaxID=1071383 RepID=J7RPY1_HUIN7|nr:hypothetical protein KNAG_0I00270 [Kazachstania naganishii CBS 8797]CCK71818.1 hypothetical protein KNAG_0I00270 [Kazachstania naganishii CBS 8797]
MNTRTGDMVEGDGEQYQPLESDMARPVNTSSSSSDGEGTPRGTREHQDRATTAGNTGQEHQSSMEMYLYSQLNGSIEDTAATPPRGDGDRGTDGKVATTTTPGEQRLDLDTQQGSTQGQRSREQSYGPLAEIGPLAIENAQPGVMGDDIPVLPLPEDSGQTDTVAGAEDVQPTEQPFYVNAKQYYRILKRRFARAKLEENLRISRERRPYLHESRHKHAMRRPRGQGGRFLTATEIEQLRTKEKGKHGSLAKSTSH